MATNFFYVYALKDPRSSPALPFYIGKGTGSRAYDHLVTPDATRKYAKIKDILASGAKPLVDILVEDLTETQALRLEAELIAAFGTVETGGLLANAVVPSGLGGKKRKGLVVPQGSVERAQLGLQLLKTAILELAKANPDGVRYLTSGRADGPEASRQFSQPRWPAAHHNYKGSVHGRRSTQAPPPRADGCGKGAHRYARCEVAG